MCLINIPLYWLREQILALLRSMKIAPGKLTAVVDIKGGIAVVYGCASPLIFYFGVESVVGCDKVSCSCNNDNISC